MENVKLTPLPESFKPLTTFVRSVLLIGVFFAATSSNADDHGNSIVTATAIALPSATDGHLGPEPGDADFFE